MTLFDMTLTQKYILDYTKFGRKSKSDILSDYCTLTNCTRNTAKQRFNRCKAKKNAFILDKNPPKSGRKPKYSQLDIDFIGELRHLSGDICAERLFEMLPEYIATLIASQPLKYPLITVNRVKAVPLGSLKYLYAKLPATHQHKKPKTRSKTASIYKKVPKFTQFNKCTKHTGFVGVDFVEHCGHVAVCTFCTTLTQTDLFSGWTSRTATLGKDKTAVRYAIDRAEKRMPFPATEYHCDNQKSLLNVLFDSIEKGQYLTRSRPYKKDDNGHVEQKNDDKVRKVVGYNRYDTLEARDCLNELYEIEDLISNYFTPSQKLVSYELSENGKTLKRHHDKAKTPFNRLIESDQISQETRECLIKTKARLSLVELRKKSDAQKAKLKTLRSERA